MSMNRKLAVTAALGAVTLAAIPVVAQRAPDSGPIARYDMRAGTVSGFAAMGTGGASMMGAMFGGGGDKVQHELYLRLGSNQAPAKGAPKADHFMPPNAKLGKSVALTTPKEERVQEDFPEGQKPKGRLLVFWGCGEHAPKGQPLVIDFAKVAAGQMPPGMAGVWTTTIIRDLGPTLQNSKTFGRWPAEDHKFVKPDSSLIGAHRVAGNYSPELSFNLVHDFMAPLSVTSTGQPSGASLIKWGAIQYATGYLATLFGGKMGPNGEMGDMVMWTSSYGKQFGGGLGDWISPNQVALLVKDRTVMAPTTTSCLIPAEVTKAAPDFKMGTLVAYGPEEDFAYPPRPADPKARWDLQWTARIRHRS
ncbi:hypothetical protein, partial [Novosphingobium sp.]|uniref:hypothetical protein n=1 Tax=Novosphingobium sp. TaxID=1874826 RepID=UPI0035B2207A